MFFDLNYINIGFYRTLGKKLEDFEIKQGLDWHEQRKRK